MTITLTSDECWVLIAMTICSSILIAIILAEAFRSENDRMEKMNNACWLFAGINLTQFCYELPTHDWLKLAVGIMLLAAGCI